MKEFFSRHRAFLSYLVAGFLATLVNTFCFWLFYEKWEIFKSVSTSFDVSNVISTILAWIITVVFAFFTNKIFVYREKSWKAITVMKEAFEFVLCRSLSEVFDIAFMYITVSIFDFNSVYMKLVAALGVGLINYIGGKLVIFKQR